MTVSILSTSLTASACVVVTLGILWQKLCKSRPVWIKELDFLGQPRKQKLPGTAIICGGSISGIVTARILADHFERIVLVDPELEDDEKPKTRIIQYNALHAFLSLFVLGARRLWPNFDAEFKAAGGRLAPNDGHVHYSGVLLAAPYKDYPSGRLPDTLMMRRPNAQKVLHTLLIQHPTANNLSLLAGTVRGVQAVADMTSIQSVIVRQVDGTEVRLDDVALVADCTGMAQAGLKWLKSAGYFLPENLRCSYNGNLRYSTLCFTVPPELEAVLPIPPDHLTTGSVFVYSQHFDYGSSLVVLVKADNNTMQLLFSSSDDAELPRIPSDVVPFLSGLGGHGPVPSWVIETVSILCESGNPSFDNIKIPTLSYIQYHTVPTRTLPSNFIAIGDANLKLNPVYGQGFAKIMLNGLALNSLLNTINPALQELPRDFSARYFKNNAAHTHGLWRAVFHEDSTRLHDYGAPGCEAMEGETKETGRFMHWFEMKLITAASQDDEVGSALWHIRNLLAADRVLLAPTILWKIMWTGSRF
ncbi:hypothetical protein C8R44DRAFT_893670 [Mycena epipterygia]|nr:hypothetical protein C8R44DRAFT_893670 [Mycena epipterygia]